MTRYRRIIRRPGPAKLRRWAIALHESGHMVAYGYLCETWAQGFVWGRGDQGGVCAHGIGGRDYFAHAVAVAAGNVGQGMVRWVPVPAGRPRRVRGPRPQTMRMLPDQEAVEKIIGFMPPAATPKIFTGDVEDAAIRFTREYAGEIIRVAERLYLRGRAFVPASKKEIVPVDVLPGEVIHVAACAAKGSSNVAT